MDQTHLLSGFERGFFVLDRLAQTYVCLRNLGCVMHDDSTKLQACPLIC